MRCERFTESFLGHRCVFPQRRERGPAQSVDHGSIGIGGWVGIEQRVGHVRHVVGRRERAGVTGAVGRHHATGRHELGQRLVTEVATDGQRAGSTPVVDVRQSQRGDRDVPPSGSVAQQAVVVHPAAQHRSLVDGRGHR